MSGSERYDKVREALVRYLKTHQQCHAPLLQQATEQDHADNIVIFDADNHLYDLGTLMAWAKHQASTSETTLPILTSPTTRREGNLIDIIPISKIINIKKFTIENMLPVTLPLDFIKKTRGGS